jgi:ATP adenylyltransferase
LKHASGNDEENLILLRGQFNYLMLNLYPYTTGHLMVAPYAHLPNLDDLPPEAAREMMDLTQKAVRALRAVYRPQGLNVGMNLGECAGAGIAGHSHMHVLPRWVGDANFLSTVGETRVIPEELPQTWRRVRQALLDLPSSSAPGTMAP